MQVYEGLNHIADIVELTKKDVAELQTSVKILALQKRDDTADFVEEYASYIVGSVQREAEAIDDNDLEVFATFPMMDGGALKVTFTGVNMDEAKYAQLHRALVLRIAGMAQRYYSHLGRVARAEESVVFKQVAKACVSLYETVEGEYEKCSYREWHPVSAVEMRDYAKDPELRLFCWATDLMLYEKLELKGRTVKRRVVSGLDLRDAKGVIDTLTGVMLELISGYSNKDSVIYLESADLGIVWLVKPNSARMDGSIRISEANTYQIRYLIAEAVSSLGCYICSKLSEYALNESMDTIGRMLLLSA